MTIHTLRLSSLARRNMLKSPLLRSGPQAARQFNPARKKQPDECCGHKQPAAKPDKRWGLESDTVNTRSPISPTPRFQQIRTLTCPNAVRLNPYKKFD
jgi:hypothetical protein